MRFSTACHACGHDNEVEWSQVGRSIACGGCRKPMVVPAPMETAGVGADAALVRVKFACPSCNRKYSTRADMIGKKIRCNGCGAGVRVPHVDGSPAVAPAPAPAPATSRPAPKASGAAEPSAASSPARARPAPGDRLDEAEDLIEPGDDSAPLDLKAAEGSKPRRRAEALLPSRAEAMEQVRQKVAEKEAADAIKAAEKARKKKKRKKSSGYFDPRDTMILVASAGGVVLLLAGAAWAFPDFRFPLGGVLCIIGFIVYLLGLAALRQLASDEGDFQGLLFRFCPPYQWWFVATHWAESKDYVAFFGAGMVILAIGGVIIESSPVGRKAAESEAAYQKAHQGGGLGDPD